jgi:hypothetical protein
MGKPVEWEKTCYFSRLIGGGENLRGFLKRVE